MITAQSVSGNITFTEVHVKGGDPSVTTSAVWISFDAPSELVSFLTVSNSTFEQLTPLNNYAFMALAAFNFSFPSSTKEGAVKIILENLVINDGTGIMFGLLGPVPGVFELKNVSFINSADAYLPSVYLENVQQGRFTDCAFSGNMGTSIVAYNSIISFSGTMTFSNNSAYEGGAIAFYGSSQMYLSDNTNVIFQDNSADNVGGAIFVRQEYIPDYGPHVIEATACFFLGNYTSQCFPSSNISIRFINNTARTGGDAIYGAALYDCELCLQSYCCDGFKLVNSPLFYFEPSKETDLSTITSDPARVCLCVNGTPDCTLVFNSGPPYYPGEILHLSAVVVGDLFGTVDSLVYAQLLPQDSDLGELQYSQQVKHTECNELSYSVFSEPGDVVLVLTSSGIQLQRYPSESEINDILVYIFYYKTYGTISSGLLTTPIYINITTLPCPPGFTLSNDPSHCICDPLLHNTIIECNITDQTIHRSGTIWVSTGEGNSSNSLILCKYCPYYYCKQQAVAVNLADPDAQCSFDRSGTLCGACQPGLSLALGSPQCLHCSDSYLSLLIFFAIAGLALVFMIKVLNLTVAVGTINGLIFYANIIQANHDTFFPAGDTNPLTVFIAWLNLDLGIETCFFDGLDSYTKTWLEFIFPLYIWTIVILIIILAHYSSTASKIFGNNSVPVLATLILLSYAKLLRTIITVFSFTYLEYADGSKKAVWSFDGNIDYLSPQHIPLFIVALIILLFLWVPYTVLLTFGQCIQRIACYRIRPWITRSKPFFDAYFGPLKDNHRYWVGLLLWALFVVFSSTPTSEYSADLLATTVVVLCLILYLAYTGHVYQRSYLTLLENSYICNLGVLAVGTLYLHLAGGNQAALVYTSVGIAFTQFIGTVVFHCLMLPKVMKLAVKLCPAQCPIKGPHLKAEYESLDRPDGEGRLEPIQVVQQRLTYDEFREPVLNYVN